MEYETRELLATLSIPVFISLMIGIQLFVQRINRRLKAAEDESTRSVEGKPGQPGNPA